MSVALTEQAVVERRKTVTRRLGWWEDKNGRRLLKPGDQLTLCRKVMGRGKCLDCGGSGLLYRTLDGAMLTRACPACVATGREPLVRLAEVEVIDVDREPLRDIEADPHDVEREGFQGWTPAQFVHFFCDEMHCTPDQIVTRIHWRYLDAEDGAA